MVKAKESKIKIKLVRSLIGCSKDQRKVAQSLGLSKLNQIVEHSDSAIIKGMVNKISHLVSIIAE